ncbi:hypothetical protein [Streptomyces sp. NPDC091268]|uniref:hypothetical protein n=1 Tax=Streptomyces sp. NPDC091268 TaxID=3365979 RepID=UPI0037F16B44
MKLNKRVAAVAGAAVVGPMMLMATPAMADEAAQPAVSVPDEEPKGDAAPAAADAAEATAVPESKQPQGQTQPQTQPQTQGQDGPAPTGQTVAKAAENPADDAYEPPTGILMGPEVTVHGLPEDGFKNDGTWTKLTVEVDNAGHRAVPNYTPSINIMQWDGGFTTSQVKVERLVGGAWQPVKAITAESMGPGFKYALGTTASVAAEADYTVEVRIAFTADTPVLPFEMYSDGASRNGSVVSSSPGTWYQSKIEGADDQGDTQPTIIDGPALTVGDVPATLTAGGDWTNLTVHVDNAGKDALADYVLDMAVFHLDRPGMNSGQIDVEVYSRDENGVLGWHPTYDRSGGEQDGFGFEIASGAIGSGKAFDVQVRIRVSATAPKGDLTIRFWGSGPYDEENHSYVQSRSKGRLTKIVAAESHHGGNTGNGGITGNTGNTGNQPKPDGGATPINTGSGSGTSTGTSTVTAPVGGELAATGSGPATSWALGGAGVAVAMGAALVAGTGRRRRTTA